MKKDLFSILTLAIAIINLILSILIVFTLVPSAVKTNNLMNKVAENIDIELEANKEEAGETVPLKDIEIYNIEELTINLKPEDGDSRNHFALVTVALSINTKHEDYEELASGLETYQSYITEIVNDEFSRYSASNILESKDEIKSAILNRLQNRFNSDFIIDVSIGKILVD